jgi:plastocyanin
MRPIFRALGPLSAAALLLAACGGGTPTSAPTSGVTSGPVATSAATTAPAATTAGAKLCDDVTQAAPATEVEASVADFTWSSPVEAKVGQVVTWTNGDTAPHGVQTDEAGCKMNGSIAANAKRSLVFNQAGTFSFFCFVHPDMKGSITIT